MLQRQKGTYTGLLRGSREGRGGGDKGGEDGKLHFVCVLDLNEEGGIV